ncbi:MAG: cupredoxin domain-containing protein [Methanosarcinales archaeon]
MVKLEIIVGLLVILSTIGTIVGANMYEDSLAKGRKTIEITAQAPEKGNWNPREITVNLGEPVRLRIRNIDTVSHGFAIPELDVGVYEIKPGEAIIVDFKPEKKGTFLFTCTVWCSPRHLEMTGKIIVK